MEQISPILSALIAQKIREIRLAMEAKEVILISDEEEEEEEEEESIIVIYDSEEESQNYKNKWLGLDNYKI